MKRQVGSVAKQVRCPEAVITYQQTMFGVDKGDQIRAHGGGFSNKSHFKKWYKKTYLAILDCMMMNALIAWNMAATGNSNKTPLVRHQFMTYIAEEFMDYVDDNVAGNPRADGYAQGGESWRKDHKMIPCVYGSRCAVCRLETNMDSSIGQANMAKNVVMCSHCNIPAHPTVPTQSNRQIHQLPKFVGMSCFEILHSEDGKKIWTRIPDAIGNQPRYAVARGTEIVQELRQHYGLTPRTVRRRNNSAA